MIFSRVTYSIFVFLILVIMLAPLHAQEVSVSADIEGAYAVKNQEIILTISVQGKDAQSASSPELPDLGGWFQYNGARGTSQNISIVNGNMSVLIAHKYSLIPLKVGNATIGPARVVANGKGFQSKEFTIEIKDAGSAPPPSRRGSPRTGSGNSDNAPLDIFLRAVPEKTEVYRNEGITIDYKVFYGTSVDLREFTPLNQPNSAGFWTEEYTISRNPSPRTEMFNSKAYKAARLKKVEVFPTNTGDMEIDPIQMDFRVRSNNVGRQNLRSIFRDPFLNRTRSVRVNSNDLLIKVKPLPEKGKPPNFKGLVGDYDISAVINTASVKAHESVTLTVTISGTGNIKLMPEPDLDIEGVYEQYEPIVKENIDRSGRKINGFKEFEYVLIPRKEGQLVVESVSLPYFDPDEETYKVARTSPIAVNVEAGDRLITGSPRNLTRDEIKLVGTDIRFIKESVSKWFKAGEGFYGTFSFLTLLFLPLLLVGAVLIYSRHIDKLQADVGYKRSRHATALAVKRLKSVKKSLDDNEAQKFYPELAKALQDYIADKLNIAAAGIMTGELEKILLQKNVDEDLVKSYIGCLSKCDFYRFSAAGSSQDEMGTLYEESREVIISMEERLKKAA